MRQTFDETTDPSFGAKHLPLLRAEMAKQGLDGFLIPHEDEHQNEYLPDANERLAWATGFTGSAGAAVVLSDRAAIFTDGRYTVQVPAPTPDRLRLAVSLDPGPQTPTAARCVRVSPAPGCAPDWLTEKLEYVPSSAISNFGAKVLMPVVLSH